MRRRRRWARGAEKTNAVEARAIVDEAVSRLRDPAFVDERGAPLTLAVITMNSEQMRLVEDVLDAARRAHPEIEPHLDAELRLEPVVVRNLETAQGDERDVVLLGMSFGPTEPGGRTMSMNFGKLNAQGGWRRLNVALTRASREMTVFTSFHPGMIDLSRTSQRAIADLKHFIEFAERGPRALAEADRGSLGGADSPFEEAVTSELRRRGWNVVPQVGVCRFRTDLGVVHPDRPGDFLCGFERDGATYHSAATARDRDRVRASILQDLGWAIERVWSTDWWIDRRRAADRLHDRLETRLAAGRAAFEERRAASPETSPPALASIDDARPIAAADAIGLAGTAAQEAALDSHGAQLDGDDPSPRSVERSSDVSARAEPAPASARPLPDRSEEGTGVAHRRTDFADLRDRIDPAAFYGAAYNGVLHLLIAQVLACEAPMSEAQLVQRIARAHGFLRAGRVIRNRVMMQVGHRHHVVDDEWGSSVWLDDGQRAG